MNRMSSKECFAPNVQRALLVIDIQNYFFSPLSPAYIKDSERILPVVKQLISEFQAHRSLVLGTVHSGFNSNMQKWWGHTVPKEWAEPLIKDIPILQKSTYDAFHETELENLLKQNAIQQLFITGAMTHLCCETTARTGFVKGYDIVMVQDACISKNSQYQANSLHNLAHGVATVIESRELIW